MAFSHEMPLNFLKYLDEANWVNAVLAGQLWPQPVLDFYLDHLVLEGGGGDEGEDIEEGSDDWLQQIIEGLELLDRGYTVKSDF